MPSEVFVFDRTPTERDEDRATRVARIGWLLRSPSYPRTHELASRMLFDSALRDNVLDEVAIRLFFLRRHTAKLCLKEVIGALLDINYRSSDPQSRAEAGG